MPRRAARTLRFAAALLLAAAPSLGTARVRYGFVESGGRSDGVSFVAPALLGRPAVLRDGRLIYRGEGWSLTESFEGGHARPRLGRVAAPRVSDLRGSDPSRWRTDVPTSDEVELGEVWRGVGVSLRAAGETVEKVFTVSPGARVWSIRVHLAGATRVAVGANGGLDVRMGARRLSFSAPMAFQEHGGVRRSIPVAYLVRGSTYEFRLGRHDETLPVVIDPVLESSYVGGTEADRIDAIAVLPATGDVLVAGATFSNDLPDTAGGASSSSRGEADGFIARFDPTLATLLQVTYLGGSGGDEITCIAVHPGSGQIYVGGVTSSLDFPGTALGAQPVWHGYPDGFVARLDPSLTRVYEATYFGGSYEDRVVAVAVHPATGEIYAAGQTQSPDLPGVEGGAQPAQLGSFDGFVVRFDPTLSALIQATYLGGQSPDYLRTMAIHPATGEIYVAGQTLSLPDFPASAGGANVSPPGGNGNFDAFVSRLDPTLTQILQTTFLGGGGGDDILGLAVAPDGDIVVGGWTQSLDFPVTSGVFQTSAGGSGGYGLDGFVAQFDAGLTTLQTATYLGGDADDYVTAIAVSGATGDVYAVGLTYSATLPGVAGGADDAYGGGGDAFAAVLPGDLTRIQSSYLGGEDVDAANAVVVDPGSGEPIVAGATSSVGFPGAATGAGFAYSGGSAFGGDGFVSRLPASLRFDAPCVPGKDPLCAPADRLPVELPARRSTRRCMTPCRS